MSDHGRASVPRGWFSGRGLSGLPAPSLLCRRYHSLLELGEKRKGMLEKSCKKFMLFRETNELQQWINEKEAALTNEEVGADLEQVEVLQKKFDDFQKVSVRLVKRQSETGAVGASP